MFLQLSFDERGDVELKNQTAYLERFEGMEGPLDRYHKLGLQQSLYRLCHYPSACKELALILKLSYSKFPKLLQSLLVQDVLTAFRLLPRMQTQSAISAANLLLQSVESAFPKQKKSLAVTEFKHAVVAHKRYSKARNSEEDMLELPQDVLVHVFSFLDLKSLVSASQVCRLWNVASTDSHLWQLMYAVFFNTSRNFSKIYTLYGGLNEDEKSKQSQETVVCRSNLDWRTNFKKAYEGISSKKLLTSCRGFCKHCHAIFWLSDMGNKTSRLKCKYHQIKPISTRQIVEYLDGEHASSDSDSEPDSYDEFAPKLWAYPRKSEFSL
ncbi:hypothetical protein L6452_14851 [Arctium lappa]|uniref:Uncharacterized protein n=1 Tax=Arctium lappa TaxID=4217 RepID=A0ACB9CM91_ARCLA|nr:hypothetical protein L6452_14851 [Arctium lappa]